MFSFSSFYHTALHSGCPVILPLAHVRVPAALLLPHQIMVLSVPSSIAIVVGLF